MFVKARSILIMNSIVFVHVSEVVLGSVCDFKREFERRSWQQGGDKSYAGLGVREVGGGRGQTSSGKTCNRHSVLSRSLI